MVRAMDNCLKAHAKQLRYEQQLIDPIVRLPAPGLLGETFYSKERQAKRLEYIKEQYHSKLTLLFRHYEYDISSPDDFLVLIMRLAHDWIPGFDVVDTSPRKRGRPKLRNEYALAELAMEIDEIRAENPRKPIKWACGIYLDRHGNERRWKGRRNTRTVDDCYRNGKKILKERNALFKLFVKGSRLAGLALGAEALKSSGGGGSMGFANFKPGQNVLGSTEKGE